MSSEATHTPNAHNHETFTCWKKDGPHSWRVSQLHSANPTKRAVSGVWWSPGAISPKARALSPSVESPSGGAFVAYFLMHARLRCFEKFWPGRSMRGGAPYRAAGVFCFFNSNRLCPCPAGIWNKLINAKLEHPQPAESH
jgi:hypothetical protein